MWRRLLTLLPVASLTAGLVVLMACDVPCDLSDEVPVGVKLMASTPSNSPELTPCYLYRFQVAWTGYEYTKAVFRIDPDFTNRETFTVEQMLDGFVRLDTPDCPRGRTCNATKDVTERGRRDAWLMITPSLKRQKVQSYAKAVCKITVYDSDGDVVAVSNTAHHLGNHTATCKVQFVDVG